jgi:hypothetical protein
MLEQSKLEIPDRRASKSAVADLDNDIAELG